MNWMHILISIIWSSILNLMHLLEGIILLIFCISQKNWLLLLSTKYELPWECRVTSLIPLQALLRSVLLLFWIYFLLVDKWSISDLTPLLLCYAIFCCRHSRKPWSKFINADNQHLVSPEVTSIFLSGIDLAFSLDCYLTILVWCVGNWFSW